MNYKMIVYIIGYVMKIEAAFMIVPIITALIYRESSVWAFVATGVVSFLLGMLLTFKKPRRVHFHLREGYVTVALSWIILSIIGAVPFLLSGFISHPIDALFETVSGFTTTGASILKEVENLDKSVLMWRSFTHWIGGMGVLVFLLAVLKMTGGSHMNLMKAESPGPVVGRLVPTVRDTAKILYGMYFALTIVQLVLLLLGNMPVFDAIATTFGTAGTGGFGIKNDSMGSYSAYIQAVTTIFMILFGINFNIYYLLLAKKWKQAFFNEEVRWYLIIIATAVIIISIDIRGFFSGAGQAIHHSAFQVASIITTTGFATVDFNLWPEVSRTILVLLMFVGACAGSTGGGMKVSRFIIWVKYMSKEVRRYLHPNQVKKIQMDGKVIEHETVRSVNVYLILYFLIFAASVLIVAFDGKDLITNFTAVATAFNNVGPGLELVGPASNFSELSYLSKSVLIFDMLAGRLELFPLLLLFVRDTWRKF